MNSGFLIVLLLIGVVMYFILIRPQRAKQRQQKDLIANITAGDEVVTIGGLYGDVVDVDDDGDRIVLEIAEDVHVEVARRAIGTVVKAEDLGDFMESPSGDAGGEVRKFDPDNVRTYSGGKDSSPKDTETASDRAR